MPHLIHRDVDFGSSLLVLESDWGFNRIRITRTPENDYFLDWDDHTDEADNSADVKLKKRHRNKLRTALLAVLNGELEHDKDCHPRAKVGPCNFIFYEAENKMLFWVGDDLDKFKVNLTGDDVQTLIYFLTH